MIHPHRFYIGKGLAAIVAVVITVITVSFPTLDIETAAFWFFLIATVYVLLCITFIMYKFIKRPDIKSTISSKKKSRAVNASPIDTAEKPMPTLELLKSGWKICVFAYILTFTTLCIFPALVTNIMESSPDPDSAWSTKYFQPVAIFLAFALGDLIGKAIPSIVKLPTAKYLPICIVIRVLLLPMIIMCNVQPRTWPVWFKSDVFASVFTFVNGLTGGWFLNLVFIYTPLYVEGTANKGRLSTLVYLVIAAGMGTASLVIFGISAIINS